MARCRRFLVLIGSLLASAAGAGPLSPELQKLQGAWVPQGAQCADIFFRQGKSINFRRPGAPSREGVLIEGDRVGDARQRCTITKAKAEGEAYTILLTCFDGRSIWSKRSFSLRFSGEDKLIRSFADFPDEELRLDRCRI